MLETPKKLIIDLSKPEGEREQIVELTADEIAQNEADRLKLAQEQAEREAAAEALAALKASAKQKLIAGLPLSAEEADTLVL
jgi:hypothetical protein